MEDNYESLMYLTPNDLNLIENKIEELTNFIRENIYDNQQSPLRNIQVGDDLSGKTLYLSFPKDSYEDITNENKTIIVTMDDSTKRIAYLYTPNDYNRRYIYVRTAGLSYYIYAENKNLPNPYLNNVRFRLPNDYGTVTEVNENDQFYQYIKIYDDETIIPNYEKKTWVLNEIPYMQDIDRIEQGIKNLGDYFTKPKGWITTKDWLKTNTIDDRSDYGVGSKGFSYIDINRWINNLNLIEQEDMENATVWNTNKSEYYWDGDVNYKLAKVTYDNKKIQYGGEDIHYKYI